MSNYLLSGHSQTDLTFHVTLAQFSEMENMLFVFAVGLIVLAQRWCIREVHVSKQTNKQTNKDWQMQPSHDVQKDTNRLYPQAEPQMEGRYQVMSKVQESLLHRYLAI